MAQEGFIKLEYRVYSGGFKMVQGYCMKCKAKQDIKDAKADKMANGRDCVKGTCSVCSTKMFKIGKMD